MVEQCLRFFLSSVQDCFREILFFQKQILIFGTFTLFIIFKIQSNDMRPQRNKQFDWSKPFKLIQGKKQFEEIETGEDLVINIPNKQSFHQNSAYKKQNIITPKIEDVERVTAVKPFAKINPNYIRLPQALNLPKLVDYELTQVQNSFVKTHSQRFKLKGKVILTNEFLSKAFIELELKAGKDPVIPRNKGWMTTYLQRQYTQLHDWQHFQTFAALIYNFWRNRRQQLKFPLLRPLWRPNPEEFNNLLAFKPRQKQKRNLRKATRISEQDILEQLTDQFNVAKEIVQRVQMRQQLRLKHLQTQLSMFHNECKQYFGTPTFFGEIAPQGRIKDKQKIKTFHQKIDKVKAKREEPVEVQAPLPMQQVFDQKLGVVNFLATIIAEAETFGISYSTFFESKQELPVCMPPMLVNLPQVPEEPVIDQPPLNMNLTKAGDYLIRTFAEMQSQDSSQYELQQSYSEFQIKPKRLLTDLFDLRKEKICSYYFGQDDEGDFKDLRKVISTNFKKFQTQPKSC